MKKHSKRYKALSKSNDRNKKLELKEITGYVKLQIKGGPANPAPPVGPALGQRGINIM